VGIASREKGVLVTKRANIPLDSHIIADTDYLRQYLETCPDIVLDELDAVLNERRPENAEEVVRAINDPDDPLFGKVVDRIVEKALESDRLHDQLADTVHSSWLWERLSDMCDDVAVGFMRDAAKEAVTEMKLCQ
jgi:hypothetical protein